MEEMESFTSLHFEPNQTKPDLGPDFGLNPEIDLEPEPGPDLKTGLGPDLGPDSGL